MLFKTGIIGWLPRHSPDQETKGFWPQRHHSRGIGMPTCERGLRGERIAYTYKGLCQRVDEPGNYFARTLAWSGRGCWRSMRLFPLSEIILVLAE